MARARLGESHVLPPAADASSGGVKRNVAAPQRPADLVDISSRDTSACRETSIFRQARQLRDEWRRERYSRLSDS
jgi:hypothetical protein